MKNTALLVGLLAVASAGQAATMAHYRAKCKSTNAARVVQYDTICSVAVGPEAAEGRSMVYRVTPPSGAGREFEIKIFPNGQATIDGLPTRKMADFLPGWLHYKTSDNEEFKVQREPKNLEF